MIIAGADDHLGLPSKDEKNILDVNTQVNYFQNCSTFVVCKQNIKNAVGGFTHKPLVSNLNHRESSGPSPEFKTLRVSLELFFSSDSGVGTDSGPGSWDSTRTCAGE